MRKIFEQYGPVAYVSLPRFRTSRQIKEFAFVEFETHASVLKAINSFAQFGGALNMSSDPEKLGSVTAYLREQDSDGNATSSAQKPPSEDPPKPTESDENNVKEDVSDEPTCKRAKMTSSPSTTEANPQPNNEQPENEHVTEEDVDDEDEAAKKKVRRKKSTSKHHPKTSGEQQLDASFNTLRITTKIEWKRLRNKYLNQQREKIKLLNAKRRPRSNQSPNEEARGGSKRNDKINFYGAEKEQAECLVPMECDQKRGKPVFARKTVDSGNTKKTPLLPFEEGVIVKVHYILNSISN